ncbi:sulfatase family protein [Elongatibacter sediminis]|uniref:Sulfatase n=1 Tax=Elongatibacter sediminis TaxID=3119006 RepID=A0AAW9RHI9_9GAMM
MKKTPSHLTDQYLPGTPRMAQTGWGICKVSTTRSTRRCFSVAARIAGSSAVLVLLLFGLVTACHAGPAQVAPGSRPNFIVIFTDDQGYADVSAFGGTHVDTPNIDRMAEEGMMLTRFYVAAPLCSPSRAALMTASYPIRNDMAYGSDFMVLLAADSKGLHPDEITLAEVLRDAGYRTGLFGKWHLGDQPGFLPGRQGFDEFFGIPYSHDIHPQNGKASAAGYHFPPLPLMRNETVIATDPDADLLTRRMTEEAIQFIERHASEPFFLYLAHPLPHEPIHVSPPFMQDVGRTTKDKLARENTATTVDYLTRRELYPQAIREIDWSVGRILGTLKELGLDERTLVVFTSDNGPVVGSAAPFRGRKGSTYEGGMREPSVVRWPGTLPSGTTNDELLTAMDLLPTFAYLAGGEVPQDRVLDGKNVWPVLAEAQHSPHRYFFYYFQNDLQAVSGRKWKLHLREGEGTELYDLEADPSESKNLLSQHPDKAAELLEQAKAFELSLQDSSRPAGYVESPVPLTQSADR